MKSYKLLLSLVLLFAFASSSIFGATSAVNAVLSSQNPDPVAPGNFVYVNVKISNLGDGDLKEASLSLKENKYFTIAPGTDMTQNLGTIPAYSGSNGASNFIIAKFKVHVADNAPLGLNTIEFTLDSNQGTSSYDFDILVQDSSPSLDMKQFQVPTLQPGKGGTLQLQFQNTNSIELQDIHVKLDLDKVSGSALMLEKGSNEALLNSLSPNGVANFSFPLIASPDAESMPYLLPVTITYRDVLGNSYTKDVLGSVSVYSDPILLVQVDSQDSFKKGTMTLSLAIANPGSSSIKGTRLDVESSSNYDVLAGAHQYIGDLNPDDFQTVQVKTVVNTDASTTLKVKMTYLDSYNQEKTKEIELPVTVYSPEQLQALGLSSTSSSSFSWGTLILLIVVAFIAFTFGKKRGIKKAKFKK